MSEYSATEHKLNKQLHERAPELAEQLRTLEQGAGLFTLLASSFRGKQAWVIASLYAFGFAAFFGLLYCLNAYSDASGLEARLDWALGIIACLFLFFLVKNIGFALLAKIEVLRELRRVELRLLLLEAELRQKL